MATGPRMTATAHCGAFTTQVCSANRPVLGTVIGSWAHIVPQPFPCRDEASNLLHPGVCPLRPSWRRHREGLCLGCNAAQTYGGGGLEGSEGSSARALQPLVMLSCQIAGWKSWGSVGQGDGWRCSPCDLGLLSPGNLWP